jgi:hypothetical protein
MRMTLTPKVAKPKGSSAVRRDTRRIGMAKIKMIALLEESLAVSSAAG